MPSSQYRLRLKAMNVSKMVGQSACPTHLEQAGGPGDLQQAVQDSGRGACGTSRVCTYNPGRIRARLSYNNKSGVDRKHGSYARYLARRVGGELRKEMMPYIKSRTANRHQPRNRTNTKAHHGKRTLPGAPLGGYCCKETTPDCFCAGRSLYRITVEEHLQGDFIGWNGGPTLQPNNDPGHISITGTCPPHLTEELLDSATQIGWQSEDDNWQFRIGFTNPIEALDFIFAVNRTICISSPLGNRTYSLTIYEPGQGQVMVVAAPERQLPPGVAPGTAITLAAGSCSQCCTNRIPSMESCDCLVNAQGKKAFFNPTYDCSKTHTKFAFTGRFGHDSSCVSLSNCASLCCGSTSNRK